MFTQMSNKELIESTGGVLNTVLDEIIRKLKHLNINDSTEQVSYEIVKQFHYNTNEINQTQSNKDLFKNHRTKPLVCKCFNCKDSNEDISSSTNEYTHSFTEEHIKVKNLCCIDKQNVNKKEQIKTGSKTLWISESIIEIYGFSKELTTKDLKNIFSNYLSKGLKLRWVDDTHALAILPSSVLANEVLKSELPLVRIRPLAQGTQASIDKARLLPGTLRPQLSVLTAKKLVHKNLGLSLNLTQEENNAEHRMLQNAKEEKLIGVKNVSNKIESLSSKSSYSGSSTGSHLLRSECSRIESSNYKYSISSSEENFKTNPEDKKKINTTKPMNKTEKRNWNRGSIIEIYGFSKELTTKDLKNIFSNYLSKGLKLRWVDDTHALAILPSSVLANEVLSCDLPFVRTRPLVEGIQASKDRARLLVLPDTLRPQTCAITARRLVSKNLGLTISIAPEVREAEREILRKAKEIKMLGPVGREAAWKKGISLN